MKSYYDQEQRSRVYKCPVCGHEYKDRYYIKEGNTEHKQNTPFVESVDALTIEVHRDYQPNKLIKATRYVCPNCGVVQIDALHFD
jgi:predicted RNA-binding Zn-ribbon protein involved in translation (DUF1610 family)